jgi:hypothetical protein
LFALLRNNHRKPAIYNFRKYLGFAAFDLIGEKILPKENYQLLIKPCQGYNSLDLIKISNLQI